ncbi:UDP-2,4-diacetamido-2,4,6-trideoxy-beta-L-altropyranose hydrolase [Photobacterium makurazakiensis]|uniref:UDP-2,4-diacetamido-2,4, 6-trideoxy-beta-L-altropyranose hydrolase n=1 Tax=Photobacterium makurazakiensis TaxID=2910234 RepID=UPI003D0DFD1B
MKVVIRADASLHIGSGHIMRCLVLADELVLHGALVSFACRRQPGDMIGYIESRGYDVLEMMEPESWQSPQHSADYAAWLQVSQQEDANSFIAQLDNPDWVIIDHYGIGTEWESAIQSSCDARIMVIDDLVREHNCDLLLDQTLGRSVDEYRSKFNRATQILTGCDYAPMRPQFSTLRARALDKSATIKAHRVLISMGGIDQPNATLKTMKALLAFGYPSLMMTVLLSSKAPHYQAVKRYADSYPDIINHIDFVEDMAELMFEHTFAIGAPGTTSWERACLGLPSIIVPLADNQLTISKNLTEARAALPVAVEEIESTLADAVEELLAEYDVFRRNAFAICDGYGVKRVAEIIIAFEQIKNETKVMLRKATHNDITQVYDWQCLPQTRRYALNPNVPNWDAHQRWMKGQIANSDCLFYIVERYVGNQLHAVGAVRLNRQQKNEYLISIFIDPHYFGQGIASQCLSILETVHPEIVINATVLKENKASQRLFSKAGYTRLTDETFQRKNKS